MYAIDEDKAPDIEHPPQHDGIQVIELSMMDKRKYFPLTMLSGFSVRGLLYPFTLIKTRIQVQKGTELYSGTFDAFNKIARTEGAVGFYRGFWVSSLQIFSQVTYISVYEGTRHLLVTRTPVKSSRVRSLLAGGAASITGQTLFVPVDVVSQHLMIMKLRHSGGMRKLSPLKINADEYKSRFGLTKAIVRAVYKQYGPLGFYQGYLASLAVYAPNSAMWWFFYDTYCDMIPTIAPVWVPRLVLQCMSAPLSGVTSALITNPLDVIRTRIQVEGTRFIPTLKTLWEEEHMNIFLKGLSARLIQSVTFSFFIILGYETIKRWSLLEEHKKHVRW
ncbi:solute carrier family 25 member 44-like [Tubulanus polymorphus]|uniref:solute carrier family 25 member 44-like n=1 Tax=Tubulanus polymorphus TaxID=672921 RepID=UPI003DA59818